MDRLRGRCAVSLVEVGYDGERAVCSGLSLIAPRSKCGFGWWIHIEGGLYAWKMTELLFSFLLIGRSDGRYILAVEWVYIRSCLVSDCATCFIPPSRCLGLTRRIYTVFNKLWKWLLRRRKSPRLNGRPKWSCLSILCKISQRITPRLILGSSSMDKVR